MTDTTMTLTALLEKTGEDDFLRTFAESVLQMLMEADVDG
jgi:putative transposase